MEALEQENRQLKSILPKNYARPELDKRRLGNVIDIFEKENNGKLIPGMFVEGNISTGKNKAMLITSSSIILRDGFYYVFVVKDNTAIRKQVQTGVIVGDKTEIIQGLQEQEDIVVTGANFLNNNDKVKIIKE